MGNSLIENYEEFSDEVLVKHAQEGNEEIEEYLIRKYKNVVRGKAHHYFIIGADSEDIVQEGMIGIFKAIKGYNESKQASFHTFAEICINRQILTAIKAARRLKHAPLNNSLSLSDSLSSKEPDATIEDTLYSPRESEPESMVILKEDMNYLEAKGAEIFSDMELKVWNEYLKGKSYSEIAEIIGKPAKSIDNAIQRTKRKLEDYLGIGK